MSWKTCPRCAVILKIQSIENKCPKLTTPPTNYSLEVMGQARERAFQPAPRVLMPVAERRGGRPSRAILLGTRRRSAEHRLRWATALETRRHF